ncbi:MAG: MFS transporter, partial [Chloroflexi bacterium]
MRKDVATLGLIWLTAFNLRVLLFAIPPTLPAMRADLGLSYLATGSITSVAVLALGIASIPGALLATRFGARRLVTVCAAGLAIFGASIALPPGAFWVFAGSALLTLSIAI